MKKITSLILVACILLASMITLTSCFHKCEFTEEWTSNSSAHWHACSKEKCGKVSDKAAHTWDEGRITTKAKQEAEGVKTYFCSVCDHTKKEGVAFVGLDKEDWNAVFIKDTFENFTYTEEAVLTTAGVEIKSSAAYKFTEDKVYVFATGAGEIEEETLTGTKAQTTKKNMISSILSMFEHDKFTYDPENKIYNLTGTLNIPTLNEEAKSATLRFENGKPAEFVYTCEIVVSGKKMECVTTAKFSDFGTTAIG